MYAFRYAVPTIGFTHAEDVLGVALSTYLSSNSGEVFEFGNRELSLAGLGHPGESRNDVVPIVNKNRNVFAGSIFVWICSMSSILSARVRLLLIKILRNIKTGFTMKLPKLKVRLLLTW